MTRFIELPLALLLVIVFLYNGQIGFAQTPINQRQHNDLLIQLNQRFKHHVGQKEYRQAVNVGEEMLRIVAASQGQRHPDYASVLNLIANTYAEMGKYDLAVQRYSKVIEIRREILGKQHPDFVQSLSELAKVFLTLGEYEKAKRLLVEAKQIIKQYAGESNAGYATILDNLGVIANHQGKYVSAKSLYSKALRIREKTLGREHPHYASSLSNLAQLYSAMGSYERAEPLMLEAKRIREKVLGKQNPAYANSLNSLGFLYSSMGSYRRAEMFYLEAKNNGAKVLGKSHPHYSVIVSNLALLYQKMGEYERAESLYKEAIEIEAKVLGKKHEKYAISLHNLGLLYRKMDLNERAESIFLEASQTVANALGKGHPHYATSLDSLAALYVSTGSYARAETLYREAKQIRKTTLGTDHPDYAESVSNLAQVYLSLGDYKRAESMFLQAKRIQAAKLGKEHPDYANTLEQLGILYDLTRSYERAEAMHLETKRIREKVLGREHPDSANSTNNLALLYEHKGDLQRAQQLYWEAIRINANIHGRQHSTYAKGLNNLSGIYKAMGAYEHAESLILEAKQILETTLGKDDPEYFVCLNNLALLQFAKKDHQSAIAYLDQSRRANHRYLTRALPSLSQQRQTSYLKRHYRSSFFFAMSAALGIPGDPNLEELAVEWVINGKAVGHEALATEKLVARDSRNSTLKKIGNRLRSVRQRLASLTLAQVEPGKQADRDRNSELKNLTEQEAKLSQEISAAIGSEVPISTWIDLKSVKNAIPESGVLIEFVQFDPFDYHNWSNPWQPPIYVAWIISSSGRIKIVDLGPAKDIDLAIKAANKLVSEPHELARQLQNTGEIQALQSLNRQLDEVARLVWQPVAAELPDGTEHLIISPDSSLWLVPWNALPVDEGKFLLEEFSVRLEISGRYLAKDSSTDRRVKRPFIFADPDYDLSAHATENAIRAMFPKKQPESYTRRVASRSALAKVGRLPNTMVEAQSVAPSLARITGDEPQIYAGKWALETVVKEVKNPRVLMLSTHGFFLPDQVVDDANRNQSQRISDTRASVILSVDGKPIENPLLRCGLLFAGCNTGSGEQGDDGVLTGMEVISLDLSGTELVVLSACETGIGDINNGEGVAGLRQAFQLAGAQSVVATLWSVPDRDSSLIMNDFFKHLADGRTRSEALRLAQIARINARRARHGAAHPFFWAAFTLTGSD